MSSRLDFGSVGSSTAVQTVSSVSYGGFPVKASVTSEMVSQAVEEILPNVDVSEEVRTSLRKLLATDVDAAHAKDMFLSSVEKAGASYSTLEKAKVNISQELTREAVSELTAYAPEYTLRFHNGENHDHGPAAAKRQIDTRILHDSLPMRARPAVIDGRAAVSVKDIGGDPMHYVLHGITGVHVCCPLYDVKDPQRFVTRDLRCKVILADPSSSDDQRLMAQRYLVRDPTFVCGKLAQDCDVVAAACMSVHVYDVEMSEWPQILQAASCGMHRGCLLFPKEAYSRSSGVLGATAGEYEVDLDQGKIYMGFRNSPAWWYSHNWLDFMRYGVDQLISTSNGTYSYHVSEVRGDTIFFEILMVSDYAEVQEQCYRLPGVRMVRVDGFETAAGGSRDPVTGGFTELRPKVHWFPEPLWNDMVSHASLLFERNVMTYDKLFNHYRSVSPRNTINGVLISGGHRVSMSEVVPLVVHAGICGASASLLGQKTSKGLIGREMRQRLASKRGSLKLMFDSIVTALKVSSGIFSPFVTLLSRMRGVTDAVLLDSLVQWSVVPQVQVVDFSSLVGSADLRRYGATFKLGDAEMMLHVVAASSMPADHARAQGQLEQLRESVASALGGSEEPVQALREQDTRPTASDDLDVEEQSRLAAIRECIEEHELEGKHLAEYVKMVHKAVTDSVGRPVEEVLRRRAEEYGQPDMWLVRGGVLCDSVLGSLVSDFRHSAVHVMDDKGSRVVTVVEEEVENSKGEVRDVLTLGDCSIDGWVLTVDSLVIYNGPRILEALRAALLVSHRYEVTVMQGAPGCGKTYTLLEQMGPDDVALCPARESALDTRKRGQKKYPWYTKPKWRWASLDSYLSNYEQRKDLRADVLRADEIFIDKKGKFCAAAGLLGVRAVKGYGDDKQIPPFQRVQMVAKHSKTTANKIENEYRVFRLPGDALAAVAKFYDFKVRTFNPIARSITVVTDWRQLEVPDGKVYALVMYQADKKEVRKMLKSLIEQGKVVVMSVHESQGKTLSNVWLFRIDSRQRSDNMCLFDRQEYALVAMTRHDKTFAYIRPRDLGDKIDQWAKVASDPRRIAAAMDTGTLGQSIEML